MSSRRPSPVAATQLVPVEELMALWPKHARRVRGGRTELVRPPPLPAARKARRRALRGAGAAALGLALGLSSGGGAARLQGQPERVPAPSAALAPSTHRPAQERPAPQPAGPTPVAKPVAVRAKTPRASVGAAAEALAAGDLPRAAVLYERLAEQEPQTPAYAEAARILRTGASDPPAAERAAPQP